MPQRPLRNSTQDTSPLPEEGIAVLAREAVDRRIAELQAELTLLQEARDDYDRALQEELATKG